mmetsp:Transcript_3894/g.5106  ORF Transcript_3894/g.5106 Transcript_3894/m.5106 type:complete len:248 (-) Transcript_3894:453-1196(-)
MGTSFLYVAGRQRRRLLKIVLFLFKYNQNLKKRRLVPSMCRIEDSIPCSATSTRSSAVIAMSNAGRISMATPIPGKGLMRAPTQKAISDGCSRSDNVGIGPISCNNASIWPGDRSFFFGQFNPSIYQGHAIGHLQIGTGKFAYAAHGTRQGNWIVAAFFRRFFLGRIQKFYPSFSPSTPVMHRIQFTRNSKTFQSLEFNAQGMIFFHHNWIANKLDLDTILQRQGLSRICKAGSTDHSKVRSFVLDY